MCHACTVYNKETESADDKNVLLCRQVVKHEEMFTISCFTSCLLQMKMSQLTIEALFESPAVFR